MTISVVIATYNGEQFLREQLDSVLAQTLMPSEIIVSDDGSTDASWAILEEYKKKYPKLFRLYKNEGIHGPHANFKYAFQYVTCDLVAPCDQDDVWMPEKLALCVERMNENTSFVFCQEKMRHEDSREELMSHTMPILRKCIFGEVIPGHILICRREALEVFAIAPEITYDWGMTLYAAIQDAGVGIDYVGCVWRRHEQVVTSQYSAHNTTRIEYISKWKKLFRSIRMMRGGVHSEVVAKRMNSLGKILEHYHKDTEAKVAFDIEKQTPHSLLNACKHYMQLMMREDTFKSASLRTKIGMMSYAYCYPAIWWYNYHTHDSL